MYFFIKGIEGYSFVLDKEKLLITIYQGKELIDIIHIDSIDSMEQEVKDYMFKYVI